MSRHRGAKRLRR